jgi:hypothetical protein
MTHIKQINAAKPDQSSDSVALEYCYCPCDGTVVCPPYIGAAW